jgi:hypothetical protein
MKISTSNNNGPDRLFVSAQPQARWSKTSCGVLGDTEDGLGLIHVAFNGTLGTEHFRSTQMTPSRYIAGVPVYDFPTVVSVKYENVVISKYGRIPVTPVTVADRLDKKARNLTKSLEEAGRDLAGKEDPAVGAMKKLAEAARTAAVAMHKQKLSDNDCAKRASDLERELGLK